MNTAQFESPTTGSGSHAAPADDADVTLVRGRESVRMPPLLPAVDDDEVAVADSPLARLILTREGRDTTRPPAVDASATGSHTGTKALPVAVLTNDARFVAQLRSAMEGICDVTAVDTPDGAAALAVSGRCPILITDTVVTRSAIEALRARLRSHDPACALIVAGPRDHGGMFIGFQSSGVVDGFLLKPATAAATQIVVESATKRYRAAGADAGEPTRMRSRSRTRPPRSLAKQPSDAIVRATPTVEVHAPRASHAVAPASAPAPVSKHSVPRPSWPLLIAAIAVVGTIVWWITWQRVPDIDPQQVIARHLALADEAQQDGRWFGARDSVAHHLQTVLALDPQNLVAQRGLDRVAIELSRKTQAAMSHERLAEAMASLEQLRQLQPDYAELPLLESQLQILRDTVLASHLPQPAEQAKKPEPAAMPAATASSRPRPIERTPVIERAPVAPKPAKAAATTAQAAPTPTATTSTSAASKADAPAAATVASAIPAPVAQTPAVPAPAPTSSSTQASTSTTRSAAPATPLDQPAAIPSAPAGSTPEATPPTILKYVPPVFPQEARARGMEGWVMLALQVTPDGTVVDARVADGERRQLFSRAALAAVRQWKYSPRPHTADTIPINVRLEFRLNND